MIAFLCVLVGFYIVADAIYLAAKANGEKRHCVLAKYTSAVMSGIYLMLFSEDTDINLLYGLTIALFMWGETYYRIVNYIYITKPKLNNWIDLHINTSLRRKGDIK